MQRNSGSTDVWPLVRTQPTSTGTVGLQDTANINRNCGSTGTLSDLVLGHNYHTGTVCLMLVTDFVLGHCQHKQKQWVYRRFTDCALGHSHYICKLQMRWYEHADLVLGRNHHIQELLKYVWRCCPVWELLIGHWQSWVVKVHNIITIAIVICCLTPVWNSMLHGSSIDIFIMIQSPTTLGLGLHKQSYSL